jgi:hypothetical protein
VAAVLPGLPVLPEAVSTPLPPMSYRTFYSGIPRFFEV